MKGASKKPASAAPVGTHKKVTYTLPPDARRSVDENWRFHETLDKRFADSKSEYVADLVRRDAAQKENGKEKTRR